MRRDRRTNALALVLGPALLAAALTAAPAASAAVPPEPNPPIARACGLDLTLVLDASGSVSSSHAVDDVRNAGDALLTALKNTSSTAQVSQFASLSQVLAPRTLVDDGSMTPGGVHADALQNYYDPIPPRPSNVNIYSYRGSGSAQAAGSFTAANGSTQYTNWDQGLDRAGAAGGELMVFVTDGDPTGYDFDHAGDPFRPQDVAVNTNRGAANQLTLDRAVEEANQAKDAGTRVLAVGVGDALSNAASRDRLVQLSGPQVVRDDDLDDVDDLNEIDVALVTDFADLAQFMRSIVLELCSPSLTVRKLSQTADDGTYQPEAGREITVTPTVPGGDGFDWILPDTTPAASKTEPTDANGFAQFQWEPNPGEASSTATVAESTSATHTPGRPGQDDDYRCELRNEAGEVRVLTGDFADPSDPRFELDPIGQEVVTCTLWNSFDYAPDIALDKVNSPTQIRGDVTPPHTVTSSYTATNPGNTPLADVAVVDDRCGPVVPVQSGGRNVGDTDADGLLDPGEEWRFTCSHPVRVSRSVDPAGRNIVNTARVTGVDPAGTVVTDDARDDVDVFTPAIALDKTVNGAESDVLIQGEDAAYRYVVTNAGNTPLADVDLDDDTAPCTEPTLVDDGDGDSVLAVGESWTYTCTYAPDTDVVNTAEVSGVPLDPVTSNPFPSPNPPVRASDTASVTVVNPDIDLTKTADPGVVLLDPGTNPPGEPVTYTFEASNNGTAPLGRTDGGSAVAAGWVTDPQCDDPAEYQSGDADGDELLDPGETWTFTCQNTVDRTTPNTASITGQPTDADGTPLPVDPVSDDAQALVEAVQPAIDITKTTLVPVVLDPGAPAVAGPDTPTPRPAQYRYQVTNPGDVPLGLGAGPTDDKCAPLVRSEGDTNGDGRLDPEEVWLYTCSTVLDRDDAEGAVGDGPATVENTVDVTGVPFFDGDPVPDKQATASDRAEVDVIEPGLRLTKTASASVVSSGGEVTYTVRAQNTGTSDLRPTELTDDKCGLVYRSGDGDDDGVIDGADTDPETWTFTCTRTIQGDSASAADVNVASVTAVDQLGNSYADSDSETVRVINPAIALTKSVDHDLVPVGSTVTYTFEARNVGTSPIPAEDALDEVSLVDIARPPLGPDCLSPRLVEKRGGDQDDVLERDPAEVWVYQCHSRIARPTTNLGEVRAVGGRPVGLDFPVEDYAIASVRPFRPAVDIVKTANPTRLQDSGEVTYTYEVTNTGTVPLADVAETISDDTCADVQYVRGDTDDDGLLDSPRSIFEDRADERWVFSCTTTVSEDTTNTVVVTGDPTDQSGQRLCGPGSSTGSGDLPPCAVNASDQANVEVVPSPAPGPTPDPDPPGLGGGPDDPGGPEAPGSPDGPSLAGPPGWDGGGLGETGAPAGLFALLGLGLVLVTGGGGLLVAARRQRSSGA